MISAISVNYNNRISFKAGTGKYSLRRSSAPREIRTNNNIECVINTPASPEQRKWTDIVYRLPSDQYLACIDRFISGTLPKGDKKEAYYKALIETMTPEELSAYVSQIYPDTFATEKKGKNETKFKIKDVDDFVDTRKVVETSGKPYTGTLYGEKDGKKISMHYVNGFIAELMENGKIKRTYTQYRNYSRKEAVTINEFEETASGVTRRKKTHIVFGPNGRIVTVNSDGTQEVTKYKDGFVLVKATRDSQDGVTKREYYDKDGNVIQKSVEKKVGDKTYGVIRFYQDTDEIKEAKTISYMFGDEKHKLFLANNNLILHNETTDTNLILSTEESTPEEPVLNITYYSQKSDKPTTVGINKDGRLIHLNGRDPNAILKIISETKEALAEGKKAFKNGFDFETATSIVNKI